MPRRVVDLLASRRRIYGSPQIVAVWKMVPICFICGAFSGREMARTYATSGLIRTLFQTPGFNPKKKGITGASKVGNAH